ncbi:hypothetical protein ACFFLS_10085 [Flavobacterium procerum]|uniref:SMI1/KNR4 family protein n=1 Tax=Flavobacterium procerum TaxID=1455569 RepID=A0ABV6BPK2_9FLAO
MKKIEFTNTAFDIEKMIGVKPESLDNNIIALAQICSRHWTVEEAQMIINESKKLKDKEIYDYVVPGTELTISVDKDYVYFFDWRTPQEEEDFSWTFDEFIDFMERFKDFISKNQE